jgi:hypothetical protein
MFVGEALSRQISMSLIDTPQSLTGYKEFFRYTNYNTSTHAVC